MSAVLGLKCPCDAASGAVAAPVGTFVCVEPGVMSSLKARIAKGRNRLQVLRRERFDVGFPGCQHAESCVTV
jgi:hypothetical protein